MNQLFFYLFQVIAASGLLYGYYHFALRNKRFHRYNRFYLLMAIVISSFIPFLNIPVYFSQKETESSVMLQTLQVISSPSLSSESPIVSTAIHTESITATWFTTANVIYLLYLFILSFFLIRVLISLGKIRFIIKKNPAEQIDRIKFINTDEPGAPFSFFRWLFWNRKIDLHSEKGEQIFRHELFHIQQKHSWDIIFMEFISTIFWINPFFHLIKKELNAIHEFLADEFAIKEDKSWQYAELLLMQVLNTNTHLVNPFFHNQIKRRIAMITSSKKPSYQYLRKMMVLPVAAITIFLFAFNYQNKKIDPHEFEKAINSITVVIDAGHGGTDAGAKTKDGKYTEAELSLAIAKKIEALGPEYNINVIMTRKDEKFPGYATNKNDALKERVELVNNLNPRAFVTIHMNTTSDFKQDSKSGFDAYITKQRYNNPDIQLATSVLGELKKIYTTREEIKQRGNASIYVIDEAKSPSLLLECGFINNPKDISFVTNEKNKEKIARAILKGLVTFANAQQKDDLESHFLQNKNEGDTSKPKKLKGINEYENYMVVVNGIVQLKRGFKAIDSSFLFAKEGVEFTIYKDSSGVKKYGQKGKDGVIEVTTNKNSTKTNIKEAAVNESGKTQPTIYKLVEVPVPTKRSPTLVELKSWADSKMYGVWIDANRISNDDLERYKPSDFGWYNVSKLTKNAINYGKHYYQVNLYSQKYYDEKINNGKERPVILVGNIRLVDTTKPGKDKPLIVIDGKPMPGIELNKIDSIVPVNDIEKINVWKGDNATNKYGDKGKNGVIEIVTKKTKIKEVETWRTEPINDFDNIVFEKVEIEASFRGGYEEWKNYLERNLDKNIPVKNGCKPGTYTVVVQFIVGKDGRVSDVRALTNHGFGMEEEAMRMIKKGPDWVPAIQNGHNVKAYRKQPFTFVVADPKISISHYSDAPIYAYLINSNEGTTINLGDLKKVNQLKLQKKDPVQNCELVSFKITIDKPNPGNEIKKVKDFVIIGNSFSSELLKAIDDLDSETIIILEDIKVKVDNSIKKLPPRIYQVNSITTTPD
jgi:bla regulator protein blaR1